ncbi:unnamed protein product, partial [Durusdinium trenchii]
MDDPAPVLRLLKRRLRPISGRAQLQALPASPTSAGPKNQWPGYPARAAFTGSGEAVAAGRQGPVEVNVSYRRSCRSEQLPKKTSSKDLEAKIKKEPQPLEGTKPPSDQPLEDVPGQEFSALSFVLLPQSSLCKKAPGCVQLSRPGCTLNARSYRLLGGALEVTSAGCAGLWPELEQILLPMAQRAVQQAHSLCIWLHGPRGSGKSRLMWGAERSQSMAGLLARIIFKTLQELQLLPIKENDDRVLVTLQFLKFGVQTELCGDCLVGPNFDPRLKPRDAALQEHGFIMEGAAEREVRHPQEFRVRRRIGTAVLATTIHLLDLVGAEMSGVKVNKNTPHQEDKTLKAVLRVVDALAEDPEYRFRDGHTAPRYIPYRDSKVTRLLRPCFGGPGRAVLFGLAAEGHDAMLATLELAQRNERQHTREKLQRFVFDRETKLQEIEAEVSKLCEHLGIASPDKMQLTMEASPSEEELRLAELLQLRRRVEQFEDWQRIRQASRHLFPSEVNNISCGMEEENWGTTGSLGQRTFSGGASGQAARLWQQGATRGYSGVIVGGGVTGCAMLYNLAKRGVKCVLFEKGELTCGATWHAAGLVTRFHGGNNFRLWHDEGVNLFSQWQAEGTPLSFHTPGSIRLIPNQRDYIDEAKYQVSKAKIFSGLFECEQHHMISVDEIKEKHPLVNLEDTGIYGGIFTEGDGHIDPSSVTNAFADRAKGLGGTIEQKTEVV